LNEFSSCKETCDTKDTCNCYKIINSLYNTEVIINIEESMKKSDAKDVFSTIKGFIESEDDEY
jgi:hypothetical protein